MFGDTPTPAQSVSFLDILSDPIPEKHYKEEEVRTVPSQTHKHINMSSLLGTLKTQQSNSGAMIHAVMKVEILSFY